MASKGEKMHKVTVTVPERAGHNGMWGGGQFWPTGTTEGVELNDAQLQNLAARKGLIVQVGGKTVTADRPAPTAHHMEALTSDELGALQEYREKRSRDPKLAEKYGVEDAGVVKTKESAEDAETRALQAGGGGGVGPGDMRPLENREVLMGGDPKENLTTHPASSSGSKSKK